MLQLMCALLLVIYDKVTIDCVNTAHIAMQPVAFPVMITS